MSFDFTQLLILGAVAGFTIFLGIPVALLHKLSARSRGFLNAVAIGIIVFLLIEVFSHASGTVEDVLKEAIQNRASINNAALFLFTFLGGLGLGLLSLVWYEGKFIPHKVDAGHTAKSNKALEMKNAYRLALMIAIGIGIHNFSEGLAIGQGYATGAIKFAFLLAFGFAIHNATEGFGIAAPLTGLKPRKSFLVLAGLIGGGPTFLGTLIGSIWSSPIISVLFLSVAAGALVYVIMSMYHAGRRQATHDILMIGLFLGIMFGYLTELIIEFA